VIEATQVLRNDIVIVENVVEVGDWILFDHWLGMMKAIGYQYRSVCVNSAHVWDEDNPGAPQMRNRWYGFFARNGIRMPDLDLRPLAWCDTCGRNVHAKQSWRNPVGRRMGKYKQTIPWADGYDYRCPEAACRYSIVEPYTRPAATIIDWSNLGDPIGPRIEKMKPNTLIKIQDGLDRFGAGDPLMISVTHGLKAMERTYRPGYSPLATRTTKIGDGLVVPPAAAQDIIHNTPFIVTLRNNGRVYGVTQSPTMTYAARGKHHALVVPEVVGHQPDGVPIVKASEIGQCRFRMTTWREAFSAQRFHPKYWVPISVTGRAKEYEVNGTTATMLAGNAVSVNVAHWLMKQAKEVL
jgi:DNA (cytosine-5)-methyltransferase 1